ncbi:hypothetical protein ACHMW4_20640 [Mesorhizobium sp. UC22_110]|uniref:hypothetical protein n=1 Tax=unclassified Mesorhizobium TaxID=325217 RepID=UPI00366AB306
MENPDRERAVKWLPVDDVPHSPCHVWRVRTDNDFEAVVEGRFVGDDRTLQIQFAGLERISATNDMLGMGMTVRDTSALPMLDGDSYRWPTIRIENSEWVGLFFNDCQHFVLLSLECTVEVVARCASACWLAAATPAEG